jgi:nitric oxide reductase NorE protein
MQQPGARNIFELESRRPPGSDGIWTFIFIDMIIFQMIFLMFMGERLRRMGVFVESQRHLNDLVGLLNALILLTSSWVVVLAIRAARMGDGALSYRHLGVAWLLGLAFCINKIIEYYSKVHAGITPASNPFYSYYYFITFIHFLHVVAGMIFIGYCRSHARARAGTASFVTGMENVGLFWHFVDVLWIFIFPLLYLVGRS